MITQRKLIRVTEVFLILFVWLVLLIIPVMFAEDNNKPIMESVLNQFKTLIPLSLLLIVNRLFLVPGLLFKGKSFIFLAAVISLICLLTLGIFFADNGKIPAKPPMEQPYGQIGPPPPRESRPPPRPEQNQSEPRKLSRQGRSEPVPAFANFIILSILIIGFDTGLRATLRWSKTAQEKAILEKENVANQMLLLRNQISPHFFMNTLNNIHSLMDINAEEAKSAIIRLSKMMRYLLPESDARESTLTTEVEFIGSYIRLMKLRLSERVKIIVDLPDSLPDKTVHPFLLIPIVENAFKHGISYKDYSFISIVMIAGNDRLLFTVTNSKIAGSPSDSYSTTMLDTIKTRLVLLYGANFNLDIIENAETFTVNLSIPI